MTTINGISPDLIKGDVTNVIATEGTFQTGVNHIIDQVNKTQTHMEADRSITLMGDVNGSVTGLQWNQNGDYDISITTTLEAGNITGADIDAGTIQGINIDENTITNTNIAVGTLTTDRIAPGSRSRLRILDTNGIGILFEGDVLI